MYKITMNTLNGIMTAERTTWEEIRNCVKTCLAFSDITQKLPNKQTIHKQLSNSGIYSDSVFTIKLV